MEKNTFAELNFFLQTSISQASLGVGCSNLEIFLIIHSSKKVCKVSRGSEDHLVQALVDFLRKCLLNSENLNVLN